MGNVQSEPSAGGGSRKEQASDCSSDSHQTSPAEPEVTPSSPAIRLGRGLGVWFPSSSAPPELQVSPEPQVSPSPLTLELPSSVTPPSEEVVAAAVSSPTPPPVSTLLPAPSKWRKTTGTPVSRIRGLLEASHRGQGDPLSLCPPPPLLRTEEDADPVPRSPSPTPPSLEPEPLKPPPPWDLRISPALATPATIPTESQVGSGSERQMDGGACGGAPPQAGEGEMARPAASESSLSLLCKVTFKSGPPLPPAAASSSLVAKVSLGSGGGRGLFAAASGAISYAEVLKQGPLVPGAAHPPGEVPRGTQEAEGSNGDSEECSRLPSAPASHAQTLPSPPYTTFPGSKPKFDWVSPSDGPERHFRFNGAGGGMGTPRRRPATLSGPWGSPPLPGQIHPAPGLRRPASTLLAPPMFIFPAPTNGEPVRSGPTGPQELIQPLPLPTPPTPPPTPPPAPPSIPQPPVLQPTPQLAELRPIPGSGNGMESALAPALPLALAAVQAPDPDPSPPPKPSPTKTEPSLPAPTPIKTRTRRNKGPRAARGVTREDGVPGEGPRQSTAATVTDSGSRGGVGGGAPPAGTTNTGVRRRWPPFQAKYTHQPPE
ncbi:gametogenetin isoform 2-T2 [Rhynchonycteris naso]